MKRFVMIFALITLLTTDIIPVNAESLNIDARSCILIDSKTGQVLYGQNINDKEFPASTTKIMTAILALENGKMDQVMTASKEAVNDIGDGGMNIGIMSDEKLLMRDLLKGLLISSANETANIIAENISPTRKDFVDLMNKKAQELGATNTHFVNTCGIHDPNHYTTAADMAKFARYAMTFPDFRNTVSQLTYKLDPTNKHDSWPVLASSNKIVGAKLDDSTIINGIKTGYTSEAGHNLVASAINNDNGMELIAVVLGVFGSNGTVAKNNSQEYCKKLLKYGFANYSIQKIIDANQVVKNVAVADADKDSNVDLVTTSDVSSVLPNDKDKWDITSSEHINTSLTAPVSKGDVVGYIEYTRDGVLIGKTDIVASKSIEKSTKAKLVATTKSVANNSLVTKVIIGVGVLLVLFMLLRLTLKRVSKVVSLKRQK